MSEHGFKIFRLTDDFYDQYPPSQYIEILDNRTRPYNCILFELNNNYYACIPYRSEISHQYAYHFRRSIRSVQHKSGLDYTKTIIIKNYEYLDASQAVVDHDEYIETVMNIHRIKDEVLNFIRTYQKHITGEEVLHPREFRRRYAYSTLKYFHVELFGKEE